VEARTTNTLQVSVPFHPSWGSHEAVERELSAKWTSRGKPSRQFFAWAISDHNSDCWGWVVT